MNNTPKSSVDRQRIEAAVREILIAIGEDPERDGLLETPARVARMYEECMGGLHDDPTRHLKLFSEDSGSDEMVLVRDIPLYSMCEHHLLPFIGKCHIAYIPSDGRIIGLSKFARIVDSFARRPQVQERLTVQIGEALRRALKTDHVAVVIDAAHLCVSSRGINDTSSSTVTSFYSGKFEEEATRQEFLSYLGGK